MDDNEFENSDEFENENTKDDSSYAIKTWIVVGVAAVVTFIVVFAITNALVNGGKKKTTNIEQTKPEVVVSYDVYKVGDAVTLKDESTWHVLYDSSKANEYVSLLSDTDVNPGDILYGRVNGYLKNTYKTKLLNDLGAEATDIQELRLLAYLDLADVSKANSTEFQPETPLVKFNIPPFIYASETVTDTVYQTDEGNNPMMICLRNGNNPNRFCIGDAEKTLPIRPVLVIAKKYVNSTGVNDGEPVGPIGGGEATANTETGTTNGETTTETTTTTTETTTTESTTNNSATE